MTAPAAGRGADVASLLESAVAVADAPDVVIGWSRHGERVIRSGGTAQPPPLPREQLRYEIGSASKTFNTLLLSALVADGTLSWCTPAAALLGAVGRAPGRPGPEPSTGSVSVLHLATHTAGLPRLPADFYPQAVPRWTTNPYADYPAERVIDAFLRPPRRRHRPGSRWRYSNFGASVLGHALAAHTATPWEQLLHARVLAPLALGDTATAPGGTAARSRPPGEQAGARSVALAVPLAESDGGNAAGTGRRNGAAGGGDAVGGHGRESGSDGLGGRESGGCPTAGGRPPGAGAERPTGAGARTLAAPPGVDAPADGRAPAARTRPAEAERLRSSGRDAVGHGRDGRTPVPPLLMGGFAPAGSVRATPHDLLAFLEAQLEPETTPLEHELRALRGPVLRRGFGHRHTHTVSWFHRPGERGAVLFHAGATSGQQALLAFRPATGTAMVALSTRRFRASDPFPRVVHELIDQLP